MIKSGLNNLSSLLIWKFWCLVAAKIAMWWQVSLRCSCFSPTPLPSRGGQVLNIFFNSGNVGLRLDDTSQSEPDRKANIGSSKTQFLVKIGLLRLPQYRLIHWGTWTSHLNSQSFNTLFVCVYFEPDTRESIVHTFFLAYLIYLKIKFQNKHCLVLSKLVRCS